MSHHEHHDEHPNATLVRVAVEKWGAGDMQAMSDMLADDIEWHEIGRPEAIHGKAALAERMGGDPSRMPWEIHGDTHDVIASDDHVIALVTATAKSGDRSLTYKVAEIYHLKDGKITDRWAMSDDTDAINEFFGGT